jgi:hypothetical protein
MIQPAETTQITMTIYRLEGERIDITTWDGIKKYVIGAVTAYASGGGHEHTWTVPYSDRVYIGDTVLVDIGTPRKAGR